MQKFAQFKPVDKKTSQPGWSERTAAGHGLVPPGFRRPRWGPKIGSQSRHRMSNSPCPRCSQIFPAHESERMEEPRQSPATTNGPHAQPRSAVETRRCARKVGAGTGSHLREWCRREEDLPDFSSTFPLGFSGAREPFPWRGRFTSARALSSGEGERHEQTYQHRHRGQAESIKNPPLSAEHERDGTKYHKAQRRRHHG